MGMGGKRDWEEGIEEGKGSKRGRDQQDIYK